jgi:hypothetical protein
VPRSQCFTDATGFGVDAGFVVVAFAGGFFAGDVVDEAEVVGTGAETEGDAAGAGAVSERGNVRQAT